MGTHAACEADAFWDERAMRLFQCVDIRWPRDLRVATAGMLAESTGFRRSEVYLLDRHGTVTNAAGVKVSLPRHKGDQESQTSANQVNHNARCPLVGVANWENFVCAETALPCANDRCAACMIMYHKQCMSYEADDDGPFFLHLTQLEREVAHKVTERPTTDQMKVTRLFELFLTERASSVVLGMSGVGKTYMAPA